MKLAQFQDDLAKLEPVDPDAYVPLLRLGSSAGALLRVHEMYLRNSLDFDGSQAKLAHDLGDVLRRMAQFASASDIPLETIARHNLRKSRAWATRRGNSASARIPGGRLTGNGYQTAAAATDEFASDGLDPLSLGVPMLGLAGETGGLLVAQKKYFRDSDPQSRDRDFLIEELGDLLWYVASVARHSELELNDLLQLGLKAARAEADELASLRSLPDGLPILDLIDPVIERFPRQLVLRFRQSTVKGKKRVSVTLIRAEPNPFPDGPVTVPQSEKPQGFSVPQAIGNHLTDNSHVDDNYRFHDAIHLGFMAVMGWSPLVRSLLALKRRSDSDRDENEDGARAIFAEEGLAAVIAKRAVDRQGFASEQFVDDETVEMLTTVLDDLEVAQMPRWLWKRAITQGLTAMTELASGRGGFLKADLDARTLSYSRTDPV